MIKKLSSKKMIIKSLIIALFAFSHCGSTGIQKHTESTKALFTSAVAESLHDFAFDMYGKISGDLDSDENMVFSPISMYSVLSTLAPGLNGQTLHQLRQALRFNEVRNSLREESTMCRSIFDDNPKYTLIQANRAYIDIQFPLTKAYRTAIERYHKSPVKEIYFQQHPRQSRSKINRFIRNKTNNEIPELVPEGGITSLTKLFLVNTVYLEAQWTYTFSETQTRLRDFKVSPTETIQVPMMLNNGAKCKISFSIELDSKVIVLPFNDNALSMVIFLPSETGNFALFEQPDAANRMKTIMNFLWSNGYPSMSQCRVTLPKFSIRYTVEDVKRILKSMGVIDLFVPDQADFSKMSPAQGLYVSDVRQEATIEVDEGGVKATAASTVRIQMRMLPPSATVDKPFLFLIRHEATGAVLFVGKVVRP